MGKSLQELQEAADSLHASVEACSAALKELLADTLEKQAEADARWEEAAKRKRKT